MKDILQFFDEKRKCFLPNVLILYMYTSNKKKLLFAFVKIILIILGFIKGAVSFKDILNFITEKMIIYI